VAKSADMMKWVEVKKGKLNNGTTADVNLIFEGSDGETYTQSYIGLPIDGDNFRFRFTIEGGHVVFE
jgi:hypothetical protein